MQATAYCRIRYTKGDDFKRAERQREVLLACVEEAKASPATLNSIANKVFPSVATSLSIDEITSLLTSIADYEVGDNTGFPFETTGRLEISEVKVVVLFHIHWKKMLNYCMLIF